MAMSNENKAHYDNLRANEAANQLAAECIALIDGAGGIFCSAEGVKLVIDILKEQYS